jgi:hypothetical protein
LILPLLVSVGFLVRGTLPARSEDKKLCGRDNLGHAIISGVERPR